MIQIFIRHGQCIANLEHQNKVSQLFRNNNPSISNNLESKNYSFETDEQDVLTEKGKLQAYTTALYLKNFLGDKTSVVSSTLTRAKQTSKIINDIVNNSEHQFIKYDELLIEKSSIESLSDCGIRINSFLESLTINEVNLIVTHGHVLQVLVANILNLNLNLSNSLIFNNCGLSIIKDNQLIAFNSISHLNKELLT
jgi:broad specificity phosphatase PhoE